MPEVLSIARAAQQLGIQRHAVPGLLAVMGSDPVPHPTNLRAKGVTQSQMKSLGRVIKFARKQSPASPAH